MASKSRKNSSSTPPITPSDSGNFIAVSFARKKDSSGEKCSCLAKYGKGYYVFFGDSYQISFDQMLASFTKNSFCEHRLSRPVKIKKLDENLAKNGLVPINNDESEEVLSIINRHNFRQVGTERGNTPASSSPFHH